MAEGLRQRKKQPTRARSSSTPAEDDNDDEMLDTSSSPLERRSTSVSSFSGNEMSSLYRFVNQYVVRYCVRIRDAFRVLVGGRKEVPNPSIAPSAQVKAALEILDTIQKTPFNPDVEEHEATLRELWALLGDGSEFQRVGKHWGQLGFQGKDPATDFRGQGALGLRNMIFFAKNHPEKAKSMTGPHEGILPFAIAVINISAHLLILLNTHAGRLGNDLFEFVQASSEALVLFDNLFSLVFLEFVDFHNRAIASFVASGGNPVLAVMQFNPIRAKVCHFSMTIGLQCLHTQTYSCSRFIPRTVCTCKCIICV